MTFQEISRWITLLIAVICVFSSKGIRLPNRDRIEVGECLKETFEHVFFPDTRMVRTVAQFSGIFCTLDVEEIKERYKKQDSQTDVVNSIKNCLKSRNAENEYIFDTYMVMGSSAMDQQQPELTSVNLSQAEILIKNLVVDPSLKYENESDYPKPKESDNFSLFAYGFCTFTEFVDYVELTDTRERAETLNCCEDCANNFFLKIHQIFIEEIKQAETVLDERKQVATNFNGLKQTQGVVQVKGIPGKDTIAHFEDFKTECQINGVQDLQGITTLGMYRLQAYSDIFPYIDTVYESLNIEMEQNLSNAYFDYNSCIRWNCALNTKHRDNVPFADWFHESIVRETKYANIRKVPLKHTFSRVILQKPEWEEDISKEGNRKSTRA